MHGWWAPQPSWLTHQYQSAHYHSLLIVHWFFNWPIHCIVNWFFIKPFIASWIDCSLSNWRHSMHPSKSWRPTFRNLNTFYSRNFGEKNEQGGFHFTFRSKFWAEWAAPGRQQNLGRTGAPENEISELDLCKGLAGWSIGSVRAFGMKGSEFEPQTTHWWDRAGPCVGGNSRNLLIATSDHATSDRLLIIDIDYQNYWSIIDIDYATHQGKWGSLLFTIKWGSLFRAVVRFE